MNYICVIGDLVNSRQVSDRNRLQDQMETTLAAINAKRKDHLLSPCTITLGDEYQAVYKNAATLFPDFLSILHDLYPVKMRFSVGIGPLQTKVNPTMAIGMDGPAFHVAREALGKDFKRSERLLHIARAGGETPVWLGSALILISREIRSWKQNRILILQRLLCGAEARAIAEEIEISLTAVYKNIQMGGLDAMADLLGAMVEWMNQEVQR